MGIVEITSLLQPQLSGMRLRIVEMTSRLQPPQQGMRMSTAPMTSLFEVPQSGMRMRKAEMTSTGMRIRTVEMTSTASASTVRDKDEDSRDESKIKETNWYKMLENVQMKEFAKKC